MRFTFLISALDADVSMPTDKATIEEELVSCWPAIAAIPLPKTSIEQTPV